MKLSYLWLNEWVNHTLSPEKLAEGLTGLGLETNIVEDRRGAFKNVVIGKVESVKPHPNADNIRLTTVNAGTETLPIVCGAKNVAEGQTVAVALIGAALPNGMKIEQRKIRGETSRGMICSETELGLGAESSGIMVLDDSLKAGTSLAECIEMEDTIFEVDLTPNRGDCLSVLGVAREVAALTGGKLKMPALPSPASGIAGLTVMIENPSACPRYTARAIAGVKIAPSPLKIRRRLSACGIRPINNVVDVTNYVLLETGHPLHAFDRRDISGGVIVIRNAAQNEPFTTLDGKTHMPGETALLIADAARGVALAGIMGGQNSEVKNDTTDVILEAAYFNPVAVRKTAKKLAIATESSYRFERGVDPDGVPLASALAAKMMEEIAGGKADGFIDLYPGKAPRPSIALSPARCNDMLGLELKDGEMENYLSRLGFACKAAGGSLSAEVPSHRHDIKEEIDLIEEICRLHGFANIPGTLPRLAQHEVGTGGDMYARRRELNRLLTASGFYETINYSFINPLWRARLGMADARAAAMENRINADLSELRTSLLPGLLTVTAYNLKQGAEKVSLYETGTVFRMDGNGVLEEFLSAGLMTCGDEEIFGAKLERGFHRLKGILTKVIKAATGAAPEFARPSTPRTFLYDHRQAEITVGGQVVGIMGQVHPLALEAFDLDTGLVGFEMSVNALVQSGAKGMRVAAIPRFPGIKRDVALLVDERTEAGAVMDTILKADPEKIRSCRLFDLYHGQQVPEGKKSLAFRLFFLDTEKTLTDAAGDAIMDAILARVKETHGAEIRE